LREFRVRFGSTRYRILYQRSENLVVFLHAQEKDTGAVPQADVEPVSNGWPTSALD
jgi:hypothetical protein